MIAENSAIYKLTTVLICLLVFTIPALSQDSPELPPEVRDTSNSKRLRTILAVNSVSYAGGLVIMNNIWYRDHRPVPFHFYNDLPGWLQVDKAGHMYGAYQGSKVGIKALKWAGVSRKRAIWFGGSFGLLMQTPIEVFDGLYEGYGFSVSDMVANSAGSALAIGQELLWDEQRITMKFSYHSTAYPEYRPSYFGRSSFEQFFTDYNGHTYWLSGNISAFFPESKFPEWVNLAMGYGGDGMLSEFRNPQYYRQTRLPDFKRERQFYFSIDLNLKAIPTRNKFMRSVLEALNMIKIPAPTLEVNSSGALVLHPLYF